MKIRIFPKKSQIKKLDRMFGACRWIYNNCLQILKAADTSPIKYKNEKTNKIDYTKFKISNHKIRDWLRKIQTTHNKSDFEPHVCAFIIDLVDYVYDESKNSFPELPLWCEDAEIQDRIYRATIQNLVQNMNSIISNKGDISNLRLKTKKDKNYFLFSESWCSKINITPKKLGIFKGHFKIGNKKISLSELKDTIEQRNFTIHLDRTKQQYYLLLPVSRDWFTSFKNFEKNTNETQECVQRKSFVVLDTGVRTFQTAYSFDHVIDLGKENHHDLYKILVQKDNLLSLRAKHTHDKLKIIQINKKLNKLQNRLTNLTDELHWKVIGFLTKNYDHIMIPDFKISEMVSSKKISRITKRLMYSFRFCVFKKRLTEKCTERKCKLEWVNESYTSKTCGKCGSLHNNLKGNKTFKCCNPECNIVIDRDYNGARNILIKNRS